MKLVVYNKLKPQKMRTKTLHISWIVILIFFLSACENFLDEVQDNRTLIDSDEKIGQLITTAYARAQYAEFAESMSDNADDKGPGASVDGDVNRKAYFWEDFTASTLRETTSYYWVNSYNAIAHANQGLEAIEEMGEGVKLGQLKGEALVARAYAHFMLANFFSMRYDPNTADEELGIPYVSESEKNAVVSYERSSLKENYDRIEADLEEGLPLVGDEYKEPKFHFTTKSANAFATRFYLYKAEWQKVIEHADRVLQGNPASLLKNFTSDAFSELSYSERATKYSAASEASNLLITWTSSYYERNFSGNRYALTRAKNESLFADSDTNPFGKNWSFGILFGGTDFFLNYPKYIEYFRVTNVVSGIGFAYAPLVHFTAEEVLLNRAEAYTMLREFDNALNDLTVFLSVRTSNYDPSSDILTAQIMMDTYPNAMEEYSPFYTLTEQQAAFVKGIAEFRRREFYHEGLRWLDVKRFNIVVEHLIVGGEPIVLPKDDPRRAVQVPESVKAFGIVPNKR
ncbi:MAG: RagB/SusD family nutrient uptake outer membrane protein [Ekhidna sp.]|nr:RagB/SusD family nutrient uptake outer membrane protein [Ekhidna sp.]